MRRGFLCVVLLFVWFVSEACAAAEPGVTLWGGMWHKTRADGSEVDCIDVGLNSYEPSFAGMTFSVSGPNGFSYTLTDADRYVDAYEEERYHEFTEPLAPGEYTFTLDDGKGHVSKRVDTHVAATPLPRVDSGSIRLVRDAVGQYKVSWAPIGDSRPCYYRAVVVLNDASETAVYYSPRVMGSSIQVPAGVLTDGTTYRVRVEVHDAPSFELCTNRSYSAYAVFTPSASDYDARRVPVDYGVVYNRIESDGSMATDISLGLSVDSVNGITASVTGPGGFSYQFQPGDLDPVPFYVEFYKKFNSTLPAGTYTFHLSAGGMSQEFSTTLTAPVSYPAPDPATYQAQTLSDGKVRFSWADVDHTGALYYRVYIKDPVSELYTTSLRSNAAYVDLDPSYFDYIPNREWRVEVFDSSSITTQRNRRIGPSQPLTVAPYDPARPQVGAKFAHASNVNGVEATNIWMNAYSASGTVTGMRVDGPNGYQRDIFDPGGVVDFLEPVAPAPGLYAFTATGSGGASSVRYDWQTEPRHIPPVNFKTVTVNHDISGYLNLTWAPVASDIPLWYGVEFYAQSDANGDGQMDQLLLPVGFYLTSASLWIPDSEIPGTPFMFRIFALDGSDSTTYNNYSRSALIGYSGPGFDYASLTDADNDGFASNVDADDNNAGVNPFPFPAVAAFEVPATYAALGVPITLSASGIVSGWCLTEQNNSATCSWSASKPASYTFASAGPHTLYAFVKGAGGNISASASAATVISSPSYRLSLAFAGSGTGSVSGGISCSKGGICQAAQLPAGSEATLTAAAGADSVFTGWDGACSGTAPSCTVAMTGDRSVTAAFGIMPPVWLGPGRSASDYFPLLSAAYQAAAAGSAIRVKAGTLAENLTLDRGIAVSVKGGYGAGYAANAGGVSVLKGRLEVRSGKLTAERLAVR